MNTLALIFKQMFTDSSNEVTDLFNVLICAGIVSYIVYGGFALWVHPDQWNPLTYGGGLGALMASAGGALRLRDGPTTPDAVAGPTTTVTGDSPTIKV